MVNKNQNMVFNGSIGGLEPRGKGSNPFILTNSFLLLSKVSGASGSRVCQLLFN
jgi:hypothetical protein